MHDILVIFADLPVCPSRPERCREPPRRPPPGPRDAASGASGRPGAAKYVQRLASAVRVGRGGPGEQSGSRAGNLGKVDFLKKILGSRKPTSPGETSASRWINRGTLFDRYIIKCWLKTSQASPLMIPEVYAHSRADLHSIKSFCTPIASIDPGTSTVSCRTREQVMFCSEL